MRNHTIKAQLLRRKRPCLGILCLALTFWINGCASVIPTTPAPTYTPVVAVHLVPQILAVMPHDTTSYTEGLIWDNGTLYESTGQNGQSRLRQVDIATGQPIHEIKLPDDIYAEGLALVDNHLIQLTYHNQIAFIYDKTTFNQIGTFTYQGEGWGLCYDGNQLYMSNGSNKITVRDPQTFNVVKELTVIFQGNPVTNLNELECVGDSLYVNIWLTNNIYRLDKATGDVTAVIDATGLLKPEEAAKTGLDGVLNGIAYDPQDQVFYITGKYWPWMFKVNFVPLTPHSGD